VHLLQEQDVAVHRPTAGALARAQIGDEAPEVPAAHVDVPGDHVQGVDRLGRRTGLAEASVHGPHALAPGVEDVQVARGSAHPRHVMGGLQRHTPPAARTTAAKAANGDEGKR